MVLVLLSQSEIYINLHWLDSPDLALQDDTIFAGIYGNHVIWRQMMIFNPPSWISLYFLKSQQIQEIGAKSNHNANEIYKFMNFCYFM